MGNCKSSGSTMAVAPQPVVLSQPVSRMPVEPRMSLQERRASENAVVFGKNMPLRKERRPWKSDVPLTRKELARKRAEFWDTSPAFGGRKEIWDALKAAVETEDRALAQAILDGANVTLPTGHLTDAYDELGAKYTIPLYCLCDPTNVIESFEAEASPSTAAAATTAAKSGEQCKIRLRLSTNKDIKLVVDMLDTIGETKARIEQTEGIPARDQRMFFGGKELDDALTFRALNMPASYMIQVIVRPPVAP
eukprot:Opistho-1_new@68793